VTIETPELDPSLIFEQDPVQILDALLPLYMNSCLLRSLQEALASELAARMNAMNSATDNAKELRKVRRARGPDCRQRDVGVCSMPMGWGKGADSTLCRALIMACTCSVPMLVVGAAP
jgi:hypothetical protein